MRIKENTQPSFSEPANPNFSESGDVKVLTEEPFSSHLSPFPNSLSFSSRLSPFPNALSFSSLPAFMLPSFTLLLVHTEENKKKKNINFFKQIIQNLKKIFLLNN